MEFLFVGIECSRVAKFVRTKATWGNIFFSVATCIAELSCA